MDADVRALPAVRFDAASRGLTTAVLVVAVGLGCSSAPTIVGTIFDDRIELAATSVPKEAWVQLVNAGSRPCSLIIVQLLDTAERFDPHRLPVRDGRVVTWTALVREPGDEAVPAAAELYAEVGGQALPLVSLPGDEDPAGRVVLDPGVQARVQLAIVGELPPGAAHVLVCDDPGEYQRGRYAVVPVG